MGGRQLRSNIDSETQLICLRFGGFLCWQFCIHLQYYSVVFSLHKSTFSLTLKCSISASKKLFADFCNLLHDGYAILVSSSERQRIQQIYALPLWLMSRGSPVRFLVYSRYMYAWKVSLMIWHDGYELLYNVYRTILIICQYL